MPRQPSDLWYHFNRKGKNKSECKHCKSLLSTSAGSFGNLKRHLKNRHPTVSAVRFKNLSTSKNKNIVKKRHSQLQSSSNLEPSTESNYSSDPTASSSMSSIQSNSNEIETYESKQHQVSQSPLTEFLDIIEPLPIEKSRCIDLQLLKMICQDFHPFSLVEDPEFRKFVSMLCPNYYLPNRKILTQSLLPQIYDGLVEKIQYQLKYTDSVSLTTDRWTSNNNQNFIAITAHYINKSSTLCSSLLGCLEVSESQTTNQLAEALKTECKKWNIEEKVEAVVTDNAENIVAAVKINNWKHILCYAHLLNLIVKSSLQPVSSIINKCKTVVQYFKKSTDALTNFHETQRNLEMPELKLIQEVPTRWNSALEMLESVFKNKAAIALTTLKVQDIIFSPQDWIVIEHLINLLQVFAEVAKELSAKETISLPKATILSRNLFNYVSSYNQTPNLPKLISEVCTNMLIEINNQLISKEHVLILESTFVDPRFKKLAFKNKSKFEITRNSLLENIQIQISKEHKESSNFIHSSGIADNPSPSTIWNSFDKDVAILTAQQNPKTESIFEIEKYLSETLLPRLADPLLWWDQRKSLYPHIYNIAMKRLCIPASSVPYDQVFSKDGQVMCKKRSSLVSKHLCKVLFINCNS